jgi:hypothetical protein
MSESKAVLARAPPSEEEESEAKASEISNLLAFFLRRRTKHREILYNNL